MKKQKEKEVRVIESKYYSGVELSRVIDFLEWLGYKVIVKGGKNV